MTVEIDIVSYEDHKPATVTVAGYLSTTIDTMKVAEYLPVGHVFDDSGKRLKLQSGSRKKIEYLGVEGVVISVCFKHVRRGMRTGAMSNMASIDIQYLEKNIHVKLSDSSVTSVGTKTIKEGKRVFNHITLSIKKLQDNLTFLSTICKNNMESYIDKFIDLSYEDGLVRESRLIEILNHTKLTDEEERVFDIFGRYVNDFDFDEHPEMIEKIRELVKIKKIYSGEKLEFRDVTIYNSVFHVNPLRTEKNFRMPLYLLAPFLLKIGLIVSFHNWKSEGVNICIDSEEEKPGPNHANKEYKHRFVIHETGKIRQCSPSNKREAYKNYLGIMNLLKIFFKQKDINFEEYIYDEDKKDKNNKKLEKLVGRAMKKINY
jgi:hypothetical protein